MATIVPGLPYTATCRKCGAVAGLPCTRQRAPFDACAWPHAERVAAAEAVGRQPALLLVAS